MPELSASEQSSSFRIISHSAAARGGLGPDLTCLQYLLSAYKTQETKQGNQKNNEHDKARKDINLKNKNEKQKTSSQRL